MTFRNGHAILDGESGFLDAGDYRGECFSGEYLSIQLSPSKSIFKGPTKNFFELDSNYGESFVRLSNLRGPLF